MWIITALYFSVVQDLVYWLHEPESAVRKGTNYCRSSFSKIVNDNIYRYCNWNRWSKLLIAWWRFSNLV